MVRGVVRVDLVVPGRQGGEVSLSDHLVKLRLADKAEESFLSKVRLPPGQA